MGLLVQTAVAAVKDGFSGAFTVEAAPGNLQISADQPVSAPLQLQLCAERIAEGVDGEAAVEALEKVYALYMEYCILQDGGDWADVLGPALQVRTDLIILNVAG